ncbi:MAG: branched-chain amino acid ABC transporter permease [Candidatus Eremiobacteraeota bacterium]|nr:branched-chain amino acid ABC transporter permease [Candidatus Eremiobacteraeota bacterium]MBC5801422.1 branched-chain amino acid ABC transporter permease [Candidatus Eremiobacteraeota bacterium]MBC5821381.1 branched-chain amino acid ABC transporter permease [Candidatus Eremiobacteraeota bacterium]
MDVFLQQVVNGLSLGAIYALIALGYTMVYGVVELINFAHGDVYTLGSFFSLAILAALGVSGELHGAALLGVVVVTVLAAMLLCGIVGVLIERLAYRRLRNAPRLAPLITAIGMSFILENVMQLWRGPSPVPFPPVIPNPGVTLGGVTVTTKEGLAIVLALGLMVALQLFIANSKLGKAMRATAQDREAAQLMGINVNTTIAATFLIGSALAGAAGFVSGVYYGTTWFFNGFQAGLKAFTAAVLGGIGNIAGAMLGGFSIGLIEAIATQYIPAGAQWSNVVVFSVLVLVLIFRPSGLLGEALPDKV